MAQEGYSDSYHTYQGTDGKFYQNETDASNYGAAHSSGSSSTATQYSTPTGIKFNNKADAEKYVREQAEWQAQWEKNLNAELAEKDAIFRQELQKIMKPGSDMQNLSNQGYACYQRKDWNGAIEAWTKTTSTMNSPQWKQYEQQYRSFLDKTKLDDKEGKAETWINRWRSLCAEDQRWLALAYSDRAFSRSNTDIDGIISDQKMAVAVYPFNDNYRDVFIGNLGVVYFVRGKNEDDKKAIIDLSIAIKLIPKNDPQLAEFYNLARDRLFELHFKVGYSLYKKGEEAMNNGSLEEVNNYLCEAYQHFSEAINLAPNPDPKEFAKKGQMWRDTIMDIFGKDEDIKERIKNSSLPENNDIQQIMAELSKSPAVSMPKSVIISNDPREKEIAQAVKQSRPTSAPAPQSSTPSSSNSSTSSYSSSTSTATPQKSGAVKKIIIAVVVILVLYNGGKFVMGLFSKPKPKTATTQTQTTTTNANVNFRTEPSTNGKIIRQLKQGDTVTLTGETNGGWTQILHNGDTGWVSTEYLTQNVPQKSGSTTQTATPAVPEVTGPQFPAEFIGTWVSDKYEGTLTITAKTFKYSREIGGSWGIMEVSGDAYKVIDDASSNYPVILTITMRLANGKLNIREPRYSAWDGTWSKR
jgi:uncharacterized protein YraI/tetratricopeptide (TPR) repeat protein